jgi:SAM-dependent methyltransferase
VARIADAGSALGIDLSARMLARARAVAADERLTNVVFEQGDAQVHPFRRDAYDLAISVFGAMFFADPVAAFSNIRGALHAGATVALLSWREFARNEWLVSLREALAAGRSLPEPPVSSPGPFGLADEGHVRRVLSEAGFVDIALDEVHEPVEFGRDADDAFAFVSAFGITKGLTQDLDDDARGRSLDALRQVISDHESEHGVLFGSSAWLITARTSRA